MSRYSKVERSLWGDARFVDLSAPAPCAQFLWVYLLTGPHNTSLPGLSRARLSSLSEDLGWEYTAAVAAFAEIEAAGMARHDKRAGVLWLPNALKHNAPQSPNVVAGWRSEIALIPECDLRGEALTAMRATVEALGPSFALAMSRALGEAPRMASPNPTGRALPKALHDPLPKALPKALVGGDQRLWSDQTKALAQNRPTQEQEQDQEHSEGSAEGNVTTPRTTDSPEAFANPVPASAPVAETTSAADGAVIEAAARIAAEAAVLADATVAVFAELARKATPEPRKRRERKPPPPDTIPLPGTPARAIYDALTGDPILRPITSGPGDFATRLADPAAYPGVAVLAEVKRAAEYASRHPGQYTDGRRFLTSWLSRAAERVPPKPAAPPTAPKRPALTEAQERALSPFANLEQRIAERDRLAGAAKH